jgi:hypothetical protein
MKGMSRGVLFAFCVSVIAGCGWWQKREAKTWPLTSDNLPAATGKVVTDNWSGRTRNVEVDVNHLAPADRVASGANTYVVWFKPAQKDAPAQNMGTIQPDQNLAAKLKTATSFVDFDVFVTPEASANVTTPTQKEVLSAQVRGPAPTY